MQDQSITLDQRHALLESYIGRRLKQGFHKVWETDTQAELFKPAGFPKFLKREQTISVDVDEHGCVRVRKWSYD